MYAGCQGDARDRTLQRFLDLPYEGGICGTAQNNIRKCRFGKKIDLVTSISKAFKDGYDRFAGFYGKTADGGSKTPKA